MLLYERERKEAGGRGEGWLFDRSGWPECDLVGGDGGCGRGVGARVAAGERELGSVRLGAASPLPLSEAKASPCRLRWLAPGAAAAAVVRLRPDQPPRPTEAWLSRHLIFFFKKNLLVLLFSEKTSLLKLKSPWVCSYMYMGCHILFSHGTC